MPAILQNVYPNWVTSNVYDERIYNSLDTLNNQRETKPKFLPQDLSSEYAKINNNKMSDSNFEINQGFDLNIKPKFKTSIAPLPSYNEYKDIYANANAANANVNIENKVFQNEKDNLHFYNQKLPDNSPNPNSNLMGGSKIEKFTQGSDNCNMYTRHVLDCQKCRSLLIKQLNLENDKIQNEEVMEIISYILFGVLLLLILDYLKK